MNEQKIYIKLEEEPKDLLDLLVNFFSYNNYGNYTNVESFNDPECTSKQCIANKYRSFEDTLTLARTYFPETTEKELMLSLLDVGLIRNKNLWFVSCGNIKRTTILYHDREGNFSEFSINYINKRESEYSWKERLEQVGINNLADYREHMKKRKEELWK